MVAPVYRAAVIGCGVMSRDHTHAHTSSDRVDLVAGADVFAAARDRFQAEFDVPAMYEDARAMLDAEKPDIVSICTWPPTHRELTELAFAKGVKAVWCEKPMAMTLDDCDVMLAAARQAGGVLVINHQRRYVTCYNQALQIIDNGAIGDLVQISGYCAGDILTDGTHLIDMARYLNHDSPVTRVFGAIDMTSMGDLNPDIPGAIAFNQSRMRYGHHVETSSMAILQFENGVRAHLEMGRISRGGYQRFRIDGTDGWIQLSGDQEWNDGSRVKVFRNDGTSEKLPPSTYEGMMEGTLDGIIATIETGVPHRMSGKSGRACIEIANAIFASARQRMVVSLPLDAGGAILEEMLAVGEVPLN